MATAEALEVTVTAPVASFRNPLYRGIQVGLPCPPPSTVAGMLAAAVGTWDRVPEHTDFAMAFTADGSGTDLETYHPASAKPAYRNVTVKDRDFLADVVLTIWLTTELAMWEAAIRTPVWPLRLGRSQDLATARTHRVQLTRANHGVQGHALVPDSRTVNGKRLQLTTAVSLDRARTKWDTYRYTPDGSKATIAADLVTDTGQAVVFLPPSHPAHAIG